MALITNVACSGIALVTFFGSIFCCMFSVYQWRVVGLWLMRHWIFQSQINWLCFSFLILHTHVGRIHIWPWETVLFIAAHYNASNKQSASTYKTISYYCLKQTSTLARVSELAVSMEKGRNGGTIINPCAHACPLYCGRNTGGLTLCFF